MKNSHNLWPLFVLSLCVLLCGACSEPAAEAPSAEAPAPSAEPSEASMPAGHPPVADSGIPIPDGSGESLSWDVPTTWMEEAPSSPMRRAQYRVSGSGGDAECVVFYFGPGQGGDVDSNASRWVGQFTLEDGSPATEAAQVEKGTAGDLPVTYVQVAGTYSGGMPMRPADPQPGSALLGAIVEGPDANWFFKMTGPQATVEEGSEAFRQMVGSVRTGG